MPKFYVGFPTLGSSRSGTQNSRSTETNLRRDRQLEGIAKAKAEGVYKGRPATIDAVRVREMKEAGMGATTIAKTLGIHRASVYRLEDAAI